jgi:hypothetical protein
MFGAEQKETDSGQNQDSPNTSFSTQRQSQTSSSQSSTGNLLDGNPADFTSAWPGFGRFQIGVFGAGGFGQDNHSVTEEHTVHEKTTLTETHVVTQTQYETKTILVTKTTYVTTYDSHTETFVTTPVQTQVPVTTTVAVQKKIPVTRKRQIITTRKVFTTKNESAIHGGFGGAGAAASFFLTNWLGAGLEGQWLQGRESCGTTLATITARLQRDANAYYVFGGTGVQFDEHHSQTIGEFGIGMEHRIAAGAGLFGDVAWMFGAQENAAIFRGGFRWSF